MKKVMIKVGSVTYAMKARSVLQQNGMRARVIKTAGTKKDEGCGYAVSVENPPQNIGEVLQRAGVAFKELKWSN